MNFHKYFHQIIKCFLLKININYIYCFIINHHICPLCSLKGEVNQIFIDTYLKQIFSLIKDYEEDFVIINSSTGLWRSLDEDSKNRCDIHINKTNLSIDPMDSSFDQNKIEFDMLYDDINQNNEIFAEKIYTNKKFIFDFET